MTTAKQRTLKAMGKPVASANLTAVEVAGVRYVIDHAAMTISERQLARTELAKLDAADHVDIMAASIWVAMRRTVPGLTFMEVCDSLTLADIEGVETVEAEPDDPQ